MMFSDSACRDRTISNFNKLRTPKHFKSLSISRTTSELKDLVGFAKLKAPQQKDVIPIALIFIWAQGKDNARKKNKCYWTLLFLAKSVKENPTIKCMWLNIIIFIVSEKRRQDASMPYWKKFESSILNPHTTFWYDSLKLRHHRDSCCTLKYCIQGRRKVSNFWREKSVEGIYIFHDVKIA